MPWGAQQWLRVTKETTYGVYNATPGPTDVEWFRLPKGNAFSMRAVPQRVVIRSADGGNRRRQQVSARKVVTGTLNTLWYPTQSQYFVDAVTLVAGDLPSYTLDFFDTVQGKRHVGAKVQTLTLNGDAQGDWIPASVQWIAASDDDVTLAQPADSVFPSEVPYEHVESSGGLSIAGAAVAKYSSLGIKISNVLAPTWDESPFITSLYYCGRDVDLTLRRQYLTADMRTAFRNQAALAVSAAWTRVGGKKTTFNLNAVNYVADLDDDLPIDGATYQTIGVQCFLDPTADADAVFTVV